MTSCFGRAFGVSLVAGGILAIQPALAQSEAPAPSAGDQLQEIVVTAEKRAEPLSTVPVSVAALDQQAMDKQGVRTSAISRGWCPA